MIETYWKQQYGQVIYRSVGTGKKYSYATILGLNIVYVLLPLVINIAIGLGILIVQKKDNKEITKELEARFPYIVIAIIPFVWYFVLKNHSMYHSFFTYRNLLLTIITMPIIIAFSKQLYIIKPKREEIKDEQNSGNDTML